MSHRIVNTFVFFLGIAGVLLSHASPQGSVKSEKINLAPGCNLRLEVPARAVVTSNRANRGSGSVTVKNPRDIKSKNFVQPFYTGFICYEQTDGTVGRGWAKLNSVGSKWQLNLDQEEAEQLAGAIHLYQVQAANSSGWAVTVDDTIGDESIRRRMLHYCLIHPPKALCGEGEVGYLKDGPKADLTDYALKILRSIEFLDDESPIPETPPAAAAKPP